MKNSTPKKLNPVQELAKTPLRGDAYMDLLADMVNARLAQPRILFLRECFQYSEVRDLISGGSVWFTTSTMACNALKRLLLAADRNPHVDPLEVLKEKTHGLRLQPLQ